MKVLEHLKGLHDAGVQLPTEMKQQIVELETAVKEQMVAPLSHSRLNKWTKLRAQIRTQHRKVQELDSSWQTFMKSVMEKIQTHHAMYQSCRIELLDGLALKRLELEKIKEQINTASQSLLEEKDDEVVEDVTVDLQGQMDQFHQLAESIVQMPDLEDDDMELTDAQGKEIEAQPKDGRRKPTVAAFTHRTPTSPSKVAQTIGKARAEK